ncbi:MAG: DnaJ domain-containing protein [bacterium]
MESQTHYERLGVPFSAPDRVIKEAYRERARELHPDKHPPEKRDYYRKKFEQIQQAYETLSDPRERALYDRNLLHDHAIRMEEDEFWHFWRQFLSENKDGAASLSYHEKMIMDSYEEDWLEENYGGKARDRHEFRKHLNFGKLHLAQDNLDQARKEFIHADTLCEKNILSKFYVGYCMELSEEYEDALKRYEFAVDIGLSRPKKYINKCFNIRERIVDLCEKMGKQGRARMHRQLIQELEKTKQGFDRFLTDNQGYTQRATRSVRRFFDWLVSSVT